MVIVAEERYKAYYFFMKHNERLTNVYVSNKGGPGQRSVGNR